ncbi:MAG: type II secretion system inner membrane protein GspF [Candidatus Aureabacteria bacterium]|nr:type II secretion system inner membrane protein GspF [Candidatus Auribacterota bacterium]
MPAFEYKALDQSGGAVSGVIDADSAKDARSKLRVQQIFPIEIRETEKGISLSSRVSTKNLFKRVGVRDVAVVTRQLATLLRAGLPLVRALQAIEDQLAESALRPHIIEVREDVNRGLSLADAIEKHKKVFSALYVNMVRAGESAGALDTILERLATFSEKTLALQNKVRSAMVYPIFMSVIAVVAVGILLVVVVPTITKIFVETHQKLPTPTLVLLTVSAFMKHYWWIMLAGIAGLGVLFKRARRGKRTKLFFDRLALRIPVFGQLTRKMAVSRFARTLSILTASGVPILKAMGIVKTIVNNEVLSNAIDEAAEAVGGGKSISEPLAKSGVFPPIVTHMIAVGEASGRLEEMLQSVADAYDSEVENSVAALISLLEPVMIVVMGGVVGFIVFAILMPIFEMNQMVK